MSEHHTPETVVRLATAAQAVGVLPAALEDALMRGLHHFDKQVPDAIDIRTWAQGLRHEAPHLFPRVTPTTGPTHATAITSTARPRRPEQPIMPLELRQSLEGLPPSQRLTRYRAWRDQ